MKGLTKNLAHLFYLCDKFYMVCLRKARLIFQILNNVLHHIYNINKKNYDHLIDTGKALDRILHYFIVKTLNKLGIVENSSNQ